MIPKTDSAKNSNGRNPLFILAGFAFLGLAFSLLLFGNALFGSGSDERQPAAEPSILEQVPSLEEPVLSRLPTSSGRLAVGDPAYDFTLPDLDGNAVTLAGLHGRPVILNFWATWCAPCRIEMPELQAAFTQHQDSGLAILAINQEESPRLVRDFFYNEMGLTFTALLDSEGIIADLYGAQRIFPTSIFISPDGEITAIHRGPMTKSQIDGYLAASH